MASVAMIALGIVILIGAYFVYKYLIGSSSNLSQNTYLKTGTPAIPLTNFASPTGTRYAYSLWLFVNNLSGATENTVFLVGNGATEDIKLVISDKADLKVHIKDKKDKPYLIMENFPLQKWERVDLSIDNRVMDVYIDGKLLRSFMLDAAVGSSSNATVTFGAFDAYVSGFARTPTPMDPSTSWTNYMSGNKPFMSSWMPQYGMSVELTKDSVAQKKMTLF